MAGLTLDSGALIGFDRQQRHVVAHVKAALLDGLALTVPTVVIAEVWRGGARSARIARLLGTCILEALDPSLARDAGEALARVRRATTIDAIVMASAAQRGDAVLTSDPRDLSRLRELFPTVRVVAI